jgi:hypothetical protein
MQPTLLKIQKHLFSTKQYHQLRDEVKVFDVTGRACLWVVSRGCSIFRRIDFRHVPAAKRRAALEQKLPLISPFKLSGHWVDWQSGFANIWLWDVENQEKLMSDFSDLEPEEVESIPESAFAERAIDGGRLWEAGDGYLGQFWSDSELLGEVWCPKSPSNDEWRAFLKGLSVLDAAVPACEELKVIGGIRWKSSQHGQFISGANEKNVMWAAVVFLVLTLSYQFTGVTRLLWYNASVSSSIENLSPQAAKTVVIRDQFYSLRNQNREYASIAGRTQLDMMSEIGDILAKSKVKLMVWIYESPKIEMIIADDSPDLSKYVKEFEALGWMTDIRIDRRLNKKEITIRANVALEL